jgi:ubiquitin-protein ligase
MKNVATTSSFLIVAAFLAYQAAAASPEASSVSSNNLKTNISGGESVFQRKKKRKRRRRRVDSTVDSSEVHTSSDSISSIDKHSNENYAKPLVDDSESFANVAPILHSKTTTSKKKKRRQRQSEATTAPIIEGATDQECTEGVLLPLPDGVPLIDQAGNEILGDDTLLPLSGVVDATSYPQNEHVEVLVEEEEGLYSKANPKSTSEKLDSIYPQKLSDDTPVSWEVSDLKEEETITSTTKPEGFVHETHSSTREYEKTHMLESNDGQTITFTQQRRKSCVKITTRSSPVDKVTKEPKSAQSTGKGGECLRRIKREWKDAVQMGIAYDWTNMRTVKKKENSKQNDYVRLGPFGKNLLRWHFSVLGPSNSAYSNGIYHGRVLLPKDYPGSPPRVQMLTPSGRFVPGGDICLSASNYHPETWTPRWTVLSLVDALRLHMLTTANEIGGVEASDEKRRKYADSSRSWCLPGVADHRRMLQDGIFSMDREDTESAQNVEDVSESLDTAVDKQTESSIDTLMENVTANKRTTKAGKEQRKSSASNNSLSSDVAFVTVRKTKTQNSKATNKASKNNTQVLVATKVENIQKSLTKRFVIEMLKLPLRVLSVLLMLLTMLESKLRSILESL